MSVEIPSIQDVAFVDGLTASGTDAWTEQKLEARRTARLVGGRTLETVDRTAVRRPVVRARRRFSLSWTYAKAVSALVDHMEFPGPKRLALWRVYSLAYRGYGGADFELPRGWTLAATAKTPEPQPTIMGTLPVVKPDGAAGSPIPVHLVDGATYDAGNPPAGECWFRDEDPADPDGVQPFKLGTAPAPGAQISVRVMPVLWVVRHGENAEVNLSRPATEPRTLTLEEA